MAQSNNSYNKLRDNAEILKYYKTVLSELKTKRYTAKVITTINRLDREIAELSREIEKLEKENGTTESV